MVALPPLRKFLALTGEAIKMRHPYGKFIIGELISILLAVIIGLIALIQAYLILLTLSIYLIAISLLFDGMIALNTYHQSHAIKQFTRALLIFVFGSFLLIFL